MAASVSAQYALKMSIVETPGAGVVTLNPNAQNSLLLDGFSTSGMIDGTTTPAATLHAAFQKALAGGAATIDLTVLTGTYGTIDFTGKKVNLAKFRNPSTNANPITVKFGAANPYNLLGASWQIILSPGDEILLRLNASAPAVAGGAKNIDLAGTGTQALDCDLVAG